MADARKNDQLTMSAHHHHHPASEHRGTPPSHRPYWKRAHTDWKLWVAVVLMLIAMMVYMGTIDLAWRPRGQRTQPAQTVPVAP